MTKLTSSSWSSNENKTFASTNCLFCFIRLVQQLQELTEQHCRPNLNWTRYYFIKEKQIEAADDIYKGLTNYGQIFIF